jgi:hypothetical protein
LRQAAIEVTASKPKGTVRFVARDFNLTGRLARGQHFPRNKKAVAAEHDSSELLRLGDDGRELFC